MINKNVKNKNKLYKFELKKEQYFLDMCIKLSNDKYDGGNYNLFLVHRPKIRLIMSQGIYDKTINHYITRTILEPKLSKYLSDNNVATRKGMGTNKGILLLKSFIEKNKKYGKFYFLKIIIEKQEFKENRYDEYLIKTYLKKL